MCRRYSGAEAVAMGLANVCVPHDQLDAEVQKWCAELCERSPTAIAIAKRSFNMDTAHQAGIAGMGMYALKLYYDTEESREGVNALKEKRKPTSASTRSKAVRPPASALSGRSSARDKPDPISTKTWSRSAITCAGLRPTASPPASRNVTGRECSNAS
jgi:hypothetical protein